MKIRARISNACENQGVKLEKFNCQLLKDTDIKQKYQNELETKLKNIKLDELDSCGEKWSFLKLAIVQAGNPVIGKVKKKKCDDWFALECRVATKLKNKAHKNRIQRKHTKIAVDEYKYARKIKQRSTVLRRGTFMKIF
ncbi:uncharacterized protein TNCV_3791041 [Trichonephila clavipes]|nr:uncharacterized protein TNCV_3791041 [Trichonephila clavipes]